MSDQGELSDLRARAEGLGVKVDGRWGYSKLCQVISDAEAHADGFATTSDHDAAYPPEDEGALSRIGRMPDDDIAAAADEEAKDVLAEVIRSEGDEWPKRIAPCAWLDQDGNRWTDLGQANEAAERIRGRS